MNWRKILSYGVLIVGWFLIGFFVRGLNILPIVPLDQELALIQQAGEAISAQNYNEPPPTRQMTYGAIRGLLSTFDDKYAEFWDPQTAARLDLVSQGPDAVLGLNGQMREGQFFITDITPGLPAGTAGLQVGDIVLEIDGWTVTKHAIAREVLTMIRGPVDSTAHLVIRRDDQTLTFDVPRTPAVDITTKILDSDIAYLRLDRFTNQTGSQMEEAVKSLMAGNPRTFIWDLRFNGGGSMDAAQQSLDIFLDEGMAFYGQLRDGTLVPFPTVSGGIAENIPLVVLIGPRTSSASEAAVAAIKDRKRGILIGDRSFGKGSIVTHVELSDGSVIHFTVARWLTPLSKEIYEGMGVPADVVVLGNPTLDEDAVLQAALDHISEMLP